LSISIHPAASIASQNRPERRTTKQKSKKKNPLKTKHVVDADSGSTESGEQKSLQTVDTQSDLALPTADPKAVELIKSAFARAAGVREAGVGVLNY
jgi:hypothetical protein